MGQTCCNSDTPSGTLSSVQVLAPGASACCASRAMTSSRRPSRSSTGRRRKRSPPRAQSRWSWTCPCHRCGQVHDHRIAYEIATDAPARSLFGSFEVAGSALQVDPHPVTVLAPPLRGDGRLTTPAARRPRSTAGCASRLPVRASVSRRPSPSTRCGCAMASSLKSSPTNTPSTPTSSLGSVTVAVGDQMTTGQVLGLLGNTGDTEASPALRADRLLPSRRLAVSSSRPSRRLLLDSLTRPTHTLPPAAARSPRVRRCVPARP